MGGGGGGGGQDDRNRGGSKIVCGEAGFVSVVRDIRRYGETYAAPTIYEALTNTRFYFSYPSSTTLSNQDCGSVGDVGKKGAGNESADTNNDEPLHTLNSPTRRRQFSGFGSNTNEEELAKSTSIKYPNESSTQTVHCVKTVRKVRVCESA